jgi:hypothetical protein
LEGSGVEALDLLSVRDRIQRILDKTGPEAQIPRLIFEQIYELDRVLWTESETFRMVVGDRELQLARQQQRSPRSHWWWYLDELQVSSAATARGNPRCSSSSPASPSRCRDDPTSGRAETFGGLWSPACWTLRGGTGSQSDPELTGRENIRCA